MKKEIGGTFKWSEEQVEEYAAAFREGDAVKVDSEWHEVNKNKDVGLWGSAGHDLDKKGIEGNDYRLNYFNDDERSYTGVVEGFSKNCASSPYEIVTPKDYEVQEGDKLVWLGETQEYYGRSELTFGKVYDVRKDGDHLIYKTDDALSILARSAKDRWKFWGVIPRYENVKEVNLKNEETELIEEEEEMNEKTELVDEVENSGKFKKGDRVRVSGGYYKGWEGSIDRSTKLGDEHSHSVSFGSRRGYRWVEERLLELVEKVEVSTEQQAFDLLADFYGEGKARRMLRDKVKGVVNTCINSNDFKGALQAIKIAEQLEKDE